MGSIYRTLTGGTLRDIALACLAVWFIGLSYGAIAVASGFPLWVPAAQSVLVLAGASEFLFIGIVAAGGNPFAAALAGLLVNARHLPYGLALPDMTGPDMTGPDMTGPDMTGPGVTGGLAAVAGQPRDERRERCLRPGAGGSAPPAGRLLGVRPRRAAVLAGRRHPRGADRRRDREHRRVRPGRHVPGRDPGPDHAGAPRPGDAARRSGRRRHRAGRHAVPARRPARSCWPWPASSSSSSPGQRPGQHPRQHPGQRPRRHPPPPASRPASPPAPAPAPRGAAR